MNWFMFLGALVLTRKSNYGRVFGGSMFSPLISHQIPPMRAIALLAFVLAASFPAMAEELSQNNLIVCSGDGDCHVTYDHLSSQLTDPFKYEGVVVEKGHARYIDYRKALKRFSDVRSCLKPSERSPITPDLRKFNWRGMTREEYIDVCLFRIMASLGSPELARIWFESQGLTVSSGRNANYLGEMLTTVQGANFGRESGRSYLALWWPWRWFHLQILRAELMFVAWTDDGHIYSTQYAILFD